MAERRRQSRNSTPVSPEITIAIERAGGERTEKSVRLADVSNWGVGFLTGSPMVVGARIHVWGPSLSGAPQEENGRAARVVHCRLEDEGVYRTGCAFEDSPRYAKPEAGDRLDADPSLIDFYEILQLSPSADSDTIHRVYRILAQRYHPDNPDTGSTAAFQKVLQAHQTLSDPIKRAAYDARYQASRAVRWRIFHKPEELEDLGGERRIRVAILHALYAKRRNESSAPGMMLRDLEELLGCPTEHLRFPLWYVLKKGWIAAADNGRYEITIDGVEEAERTLQEDGAPGGPRRIELPAAQVEV